MMTIKKTITLVMMFLFSIALFGCQDKRTSNDSLTVIFYTAAGTTAVTPTTIPSITDFPKGNLIDRPEDPTAAGLQFEGWYKDKLTTTPWVFETDVVNSSTVLYAKWSYLDLNITYVFDEAGGNFIDDPITVFTIEDAFILPKADRLGSLFIGWILKPVDEYQVGDPIIKSTQNFNTDVTLYALFENKEYTVRFRSLLDGVSNPTIYTVEFASDILFPVLEDTATKRFVGWFSLDGTLTNDWGFQYVNGEVFLGKADSFNEETQEWNFIPQGITVYAKWEDK